MSEENVTVDDLMVQINVAQVSETMSLWSDEKKADFCRVFRDRTDAAKYILLKTAEEVVKTARNRQFVSSSKVDALYSSGSSYHHWHLGLLGNKIYGDGGKLGGRSFHELDSIAKDRAKEIINEMPLMKDAVKLISPTIAEKIDKLEKLKEQGKETWEKLREYEEPVHLSDFPDVKVSEFLDMLKKRTKEARKLLDKCNDIGEEGCGLQREIDKALYRGLPGLDQAILDIVSDHLERAKAMDQFDRRVEEKVKFGDSAAAVQILQQFEQDEVEISGKIKGQFQAALEKLKLATLPKRLTKKGGK